MDQIVNNLETFLKSEDFETNWDGFYQDVLPTIQHFFKTKGFKTKLLDESETESRAAELLATQGSLKVRIPWEEDYNGRSLVDITKITVG